MPPCRFVPHVTTVTGWSSPIAISCAAWTCATCACMSHFPTIRQPITLFVQQSHSHSTSQRSRPFSECGVCFNNNHSQFIVTTRYIYARLSLECDHSWHTLFMCSKSIYSTVAHTHQSVYASTIPAPVWTRFQHVVAICNRVLYHGCIAWITEFI